MKNFKSAFVAVLVVVCFTFVSFAAQPAEAMSHHGKAGISTHVKHKKAVRKAKKARKVRKAKKAHRANKVHRAKMAHKARHF